MVGIVEKPDYSEAKIVVAMVGMSLCFQDVLIGCQVGLPARGKSYLSNKLMRYLRVCNPNLLVLSKLIFFSG